jgi:2-polyprenyl-3-methyl-5-hydroxy-6-metoxy-1,4-benzoquinol methylase
MDERYSQEYESLFQNHWWWRARNRYVLDYLESIVTQQSFGSILDVGCGNGLLFEELAKFGIPEGVEPNSSVVSNETQKSWQIFLCHFDDEFQPGKTYGLVLMLDVLEHMADPNGALRHAIRLLSPGGVLVLTVPAFAIAWTSDDDINHHLTRYRRRTINEIAASSGMNVSLSRYFFHWTLPVKAMIRLKERIWSSGNPSPEIPRAWLNTIFYGLCRFEQKSISRFSVPFGTSLLVAGTGASNSSSSSQVGCSK